MICYVKFMVLEEGFKVKRWIFRIELKERTFQRRRGLGGGKYFIDRCCGGRFCKDDSLRKVEVENV